MTKTLERLRRLAQSGQDAARAAFGRLHASAHRTWIATPDRARAAWASFRNSWTKKDWMAGIEPLPPGMASNLAALGIVTGLVLTSLVYGDYYQRQGMEARMIVSGEHPSQQQDQPPDATPPLRGPVPEPDRPEASPAPSADASSALPQLGEAFIERFDRPSITDRWRVSDGWSNGSWMANDWRRTAVEARDGTLSLQLKPGPRGSSYELQGGEARTHDFRRYGYFEVQMKVPRGAGIVTGVFSYAGREGRMRPNEIDIEILGRNTRVAELTIHEGGRATLKKITLPFDAADGFHSYGFDWQPGHVRWYADGVMIHEEAGAAARRLVRPQQLILNLWGSRELHAWVGRLDPAKGPWRLDFTCVAYAPVYGGRLCL